MKPSVLQSVEDYKEVLVDRSTNESPAVIYMKHLKLFCMSILRSLWLVTKKKKNPQSAFFSQAKCSVLQGFSIVDLFLGVDCTNDGNLQGGASKSLRKATLKLSLLIVRCSYSALYDLSGVLPASTAAKYILVSSAGFALIPTGGVQI